MPAWRPDDKRISILLSCALDYTSWSDDAEGEEEWIAEIIERCAIDRNLFDELREWWYFTDNPYLEVLLESITSFLKDSGQNTEVIETVTVQFEEDMFCNDFINMLDTRFFGSETKDAGSVDFEGRVHFSSFVEINDVTDEDVERLVTEYFRTNAVDEASQKFFNSEDGEEVLSKIRA